MKSYTKIKKMILALLTTVVFTTTTLPCVLAAETEGTFVDVPTTHWASTVVEYGTKNGYILGTGKNKFSPENSLSFNEFITLVDRICYNGTERAVNGNWYEVHRLNLANHHVLDNIANYGNSGIPRYIVAQIIYNTMTELRKSFHTGTLYTPTDWNLIPESYRPAVNYCIYTGLMKGNANGSFGSKKNMTRAEAAMIVYRLDKTMKGESFDLADIATPTTTTTTSTTTAKEQTVAATEKYKVTFQPLYKCQKDKTAYLTENNIKTLFANSDGYQYLLDKFVITDEYGYGQEAAEQLNCYHLAHALALFPETVITTLSENTSFNFSDEAVYQIRAKRNSETIRAYTSYSYKIFGQKIDDEKFVINTLMSEIPVSTFVHELGHVIAWRAKGDVRDSSFESVYKAEVSTAAKHGLRDYATTDCAEFFACLMEVYICEGDVDFCKTYAPRSTALIESCLKQCGATDTDLADIRNHKKQIYEISSVQYNSQTISLSGLL